MGVILPLAQSVKGSCRRLLRTCRGDRLPGRVKRDGGRLCLAGWLAADFFTRTARWRGPMEFVAFSDIVEIGRADAVDFVNFLVGWGAVGSLYFDLPKKKSLLKNRGFSTLC